MNTSELSRAPSEVLSKKVTSVFSGGRERGREEVAPPGKGSLGGSLREAKVSTALGDQRDGETRKLHAGMGCRRLLPLPLAITTRITAVLCS